MNKSISNSSFSSQPPAKDLEIIDSDIEMQSQPDFQKDETLKRSHLTLQQQEEINAFLSSEKEKAKESKPQDIKCDQTTTAGSATHDDVEMQDLSKPAPIPPIRKPRRMGNLRKRSTSSSGFDFKAAMKGLSKSDVTATVDTPSTTPNTPTPEKAAPKKEYDVTTFRNGAEVPIPTTPKQEQEKQEPTFSDALKDALKTKWLNKHQEEMKQEISSTTVGSVLDGQQNSSSPSTEVSTSATVKVDEPEKVEAAMEVPDLESGNVHEPVPEVQVQEPVNQEPVPEPVPEVKVQDPAKADEPKKDVVPHEEVKDVHQVTTLTEPIPFECGNQIWSLSEIEGKKENNSRNHVVKCKFIHPRWVNPLHVTVTDKKSPIAKPQTAPVDVVNFLQQQPIYNKFVNEFLDDGPVFTTVGA